jgi:hypothetical protein
VNPWGTHNCITQGVDLISERCVPPWGRQFCMTHAVDIVGTTRGSPMGFPKVSTPWVLAVVECPNPMGPGSQRVNNIDRVAYK